MLLTEYDEAEVMEMLRQEAMEQGMEQGRKQGMEQGREQGLEQGKRQGIITAYSDLVNKGLLDIAEAAKQLGTAIPDFVSAAEKYGCPIMP